MSTGLLIGSIVAAVFVAIAAASAAAETAMTRISRARADGFDHEENPGAAALVEVLGERGVVLELDEREEARDAERPRGHQDHLPVGYGR